MLGMKILMAASELAPLIRNGALADRMAELTSGLRALGHEVSVVIPLYRAVREGKAAKLKKTGVRFSVQVGPARYPCDIYEAKVGGVQVFLVSREEYFDRSGVYGSEDRDYQDNAARFIFFTKCVIELARRMEPALEILHVHSWETALAPVFVRDQRLPFRTVLTPHSLEYQGNFWSYDFGLTNLPGDYFGARGVEYYGSMNCLKGGILYADAVVLPSERFACAAQTAEYGCGLENVLRENQHKLFGIVSPDALTAWDPSADSALEAAFSAAKTTGRARNKAPFLRDAGLSDGLLAVCVSEATHGGGLDGLLGSLDRILVNGVRLALFGPVEPELTIPLEVARRKHAGRFVHFATFEEALARRALAAADIYVVPGPVEPLCIWLERAMAYGAIPVAAQCGGLFQFVRDWEPGPDSGNGFVFSARGADAVVDAFRRAVGVLTDSRARDTLRGRNLAGDFSATAGAIAHAGLYENLLNPGAARRAA